MFGEVVVDLKLAVVTLIAFGYCVYKYTSIMVKRQFFQQKAVESDDDDDCDDKAAYISEDLHDNQKLVIVIRTDLGMGKGKVAAQCCHAVIGAYKAAKKAPKLLNAWERSGQAKITVKVDSEAALKEISKHARSLGLLTHIVQDAGHTQIPAGSKTVCAIGPGPAKLIDRVTGDLKLY